MYDKEYHERIHREERPQAVNLAEFLRNFYGIDKTVIDFGCSIGTYVQALAEVGFNVRGFDSSVDAVENRLCGMVEYADLCNGHIPMVADIGICLEVLEHIPEEHASEVIAKLCESTNGYLIFSAAIPGQGGEGHVNCQHKQYWIDVFEANGFVVDYVRTKTLLDYMASRYHMGWFTQNAMVLRRFHIPQSSVPAIYRFSGQ